LEDSAARAFRLVDDQVWVEGRRSSRYRQLLTEVSSQQGLEEAAQWEVDFDPKYQKLILHHLAIQRQGVWQDRLGSAATSVIQRESDLSRRSYDEAQTFLAVLEDVRVGDSVRFAYTVEGFNPVLGDRYAGTFDLGWSRPVSERRLRLVTQEGSPLFFRIHGEGPEPKETILEGRRELSWRLLETKSVNYESEAPYDWVTFPNVQVSQFATWAEVVTWGQSLYPPQKLPTQLAAVAAEITARFPEDPGARLIAASRWVQDEVRYFSVSLGPHSHAPHEVEQILQRRFGDCKDKTRLLITLLSGVGLEAWPALIDSSSRAVGRKHPSPFAFDHVVVVAQLEEEVVWIDATLELQGGDASSLYFPAYGMALELRPGVTGLTPVPEDQSVRGKTTARYAYGVKSGRQPLDVTIATTYQGSSAERMRRSVASESMQEKLDSYVEFYADGRLTVEPTASLEAEDDRDANRLKITERYSLEGCWEKAGDRFSCDVLPLLLSAELSQPDVAKREAPLRLPKQTRLQETVVIQGEGSWDFAAVNESLSNPWFSFKVSSSVSPSRIELVYDFATLKDQVQPEGMVRYLSAVDRMNESVGYSLESKTNSGSADLEELESVIVGCAILVLTFLWGMFVGYLLANWRNRKRKTSEAA